MSKATLVSQVIKSRIANADDLLNGMPSERRIAEELGVSRTTVRVAVRKMLDGGVLAREANGRLSIGRSARKRSLHMIGLIIPDGRSPDMDMWRAGVVGALEDHPAVLRVVPYTHLGDASIADALANFDGVFFIPQTRDIPAWLLAKLQSAKARVVVLDQDASAAGLPSVVVFPPGSERKLLDHLVDVGHRRIDCLLTQQDPEPSRGRAGVWQRYIEEKNLSGQLRSLMDGHPIEAGYTLIRNALAEGQPLAEALFCTSMGSAIGAMRALSEAGLEIGRDVSVCAVNDEGLGRYLLKSLTALESPPRAQYLRQPVEWMFGDDANWSGPLLIQPDDVPLFIGESSGPPRECEPVGRHGRHVMNR